MMITNGVSFSVTPPGLTEFDGQWRMARNRMLGYMDAIGVPPIEALEISLQVIGRIRSESRTGAVAPVGQAMRSVRQILVQRRWIEADTSVMAGFWDNRQPVAPELAPGAMTPQKLRANPKRSLLNWTHRVIKRLLRLFRV